MAQQLILFRQGLYEEFQTVLERAVEVATSSFLDGNIFNAKEDEYGPLSLQHINVCTTLAAFHIYKVRCSDSMITGVGSGGGGGGIPVEVEANLRVAEELLKKAEVILNATVSLDPSPTAAQSGAPVISAGRGAQLAAAARLMLSTSAASPSIALKGGRGAAPQQVAHTETQKKFLDGLSHVQRQTLSPLLCYGYLYLAQYSSKWLKQALSQSVTVPKHKNSFNCVFSH